MNEQNHNQEQEQEATATETASRRLGDFDQGREDALNRFPRESTRAYYRQGYDRGLAESLKR